MAKIVFFCETAKLFPENVSKGQKKEAQRDTEPLNGDYTVFSLSGITGMAPFWVQTKALTWTAVL